MKNGLITFGEIMVRFSPPDHLRLSQAMPGNLEVTFAGCEASVAVSYSILGGDSSFVTVLPNNTISEACIKNLNSFSVDTTSILRSDKGRFGTYYMETGSNQRASKVTYDRYKSALSLSKPEDYDWESILKNKKWLHISGITPALSENAYDSTLFCAQKAKDLGLKTSCDLNFRSKLWQWNKNYSARELAKRKMPEILKYIDLLIGNEQDAEDVLDIKAQESNFKNGEIDIEAYPDIANKISNLFPNLSLIAITLRESISANHNRWGAMLYDCSKESSIFSPSKKNRYSPFEIKNIVDRLGAGDSFAAGLIFSLNHLKTDNKNALEFAVAASCLAHSIKGDYNLSTSDEVFNLVNGFTSGRVSR